MEYLDNYEFCNSLNDWKGELFKKTYIKNEINYMLCKTLRMFEYDNLPKTIPKFNLELLLQTKGVGVITKVEDKLYAFYGGWGGVPDAYYLPTKFIVANPYLKFNKTLTINDDCVLIKNDSLIQGLIPLSKKYSSLLCENDISLRLTTIISRMQKFISAGDDTTKKSAEKYLNDLVNGDLGVIANKKFIESLQVDNSQITNNQIKDLIEEHQYLKASWYNELGLNANYNMKRESLNSSEVALNDDILTPYIDDMLKCREEFVEKVNNMYGTNIKVRLSSAWKDNKRELEIALQTEENIDSDVKTEDSEVKEDVEIN